MIIAVNVVDANAVPVQGMVVQIYNEANTVLLDSGMTDALGDAAFDEVAGRYQLRFYGEHILASVTSPQQINVRTPPPANAWQFTAATFTIPVASNPNMCRCWAFFRTASGRPLADQYIRLAPKMDPVGMYPVAVGLGQQPEQLITDSNGYVQVDLPRGAEFDVSLEGYMDRSFDVAIPALTNQNLVDLLFPVPASVTFTPATAISVAADADAAAVAVALTMSDGRVLTGTTDPAWSQYIDIESANEAIATVTPSAGSFIAHGVAAGNTTITATIRAGVVLPRVPATVLTVTPVAVTVT